MSRGKRYNGEQKLNMKKVFAVIITIIVIIMFFMGIKHILKKDKTVTNSFTEISYFTAYENGKWGVINSNGDAVINPSYDEMIVIPNSKKDVFVCMYEVNYSDGTYKTKVVNSKNEDLFTNYTSIEALSNYDENNNVWYENNALKVQKDGKYGLINLDGSEILSCTYDKIDTLKYSDIKHVYGNEMYIVKENGKWKITNKDGSVNTELSYDDITDINNDCVTIENNGKFGIIGTDKSEKVKAEYQYLKCVFSNYYIAEKDNKYGVINIQNEAVIPFEYKSIEFDKDADCLKATKSEDDKIYLIDRNMEIKLTGTNMTVRDGYIRMNVDNQYKLVNLKFEEKSNRDAFPNNTLFTAVKKDGKWGVIDQYGNTIVDPKYEFSDISKITVLGKWHSTEGINTAYFICE